MAGQDGGEDSLGARLTKWVGFSVIIALVPLAFKAVHLADAGKEVSLDRILSSGDLLLICAALAADCIGRLFSPKRSAGRIYKNLVGAGCVAVLMLASLWYADASALAEATPEYTSRLITYGSLAIFAGTLLAGLGCILLTEG